MCMCAFVCVRVWERILYWSCVNMWYAEARDRWQVSFSVRLFFLKQDDSLKWCSPLAYTSFSCLCLPARRLQICTAMDFCFFKTRMDPASRSLLTEPSPHFYYVTIKSPAASFLNVYFYHIMSLHVLKNIKIYLTTFKFYFKVLSQISITFQCPGRHKIIIRIFQSEYKDS